MLTDLSLIKEKILLLKEHLLYIGDDEKLSFIMSLSDEIDILVSTIESDITRFRKALSNEQKDELKIVDATIIKKIEDIEKSLEVILNFEISDDTNYIDIKKLINGKNIIININNAFIKRKEFILQKKS